MMKSLYSGVAGMKTHNQRMDVIGNNISNVNTTGYKTSEVTFKDIYYQTKAQASSGNATQGGTNPTQVGYGVKLGTISQVMSQSGFTYSDSVYNCALEGEGFFQVMDEAGNIYYTRAGKFSVDSYGNLCDPNGNMVLGVSGDPTGIDQGMSQRINLHIPSVDNNKASCTKLVNGINVTITANDFGEEGNISFTIVDSKTPYATKSGNNLTIYMDLSEDFGAGKLKTASTDAEKKAAIEFALQEFEAALNKSIEEGGTGLSSDVVPLHVEFDSLPQFDDVAAVKAENTMKLAYDILDADGKVQYETDGTKQQQKLDLKFTADTAGEFANKYEIDIKYQASASEVTAKWKGDVLTITVPDTVDSIDKIQDAITAAAGTDDKLKLTVSEGTGIADFHFSNLAGTERLGLDKGKDNFFSDLATALSTVTLTDGRVAKEQAVDDLDTVMIDKNGVIYGRHAVHGLLILGRIDIATFENPIGLEQVGTSLWRASLASGEAQVKIAGKDGAGEVVAGALEMSNVDLAQEFSDMIITQRGYQANSRVITVSDTMLEELINLKR